MQRLHFVEYKAIFKTVLAKYFPLQSGHTGTGVDTIFQVARVFCLTGLCALFVQLTIIIVCVTGW